MAEYAIDHKSRALVTRDAVPFPFPFESLINNTSACEPQKTLQVLVMVGQFVRVPCPVLCQFRPKVSGIDCVKLVRDVLTF
jgi:hypothetical protein